MIPKKERTLDVYENAGAWMRLLKTVGTKAVCEASKVLSAPEQDKMLRALGLIDVVCCNAKDRMFHENPEASNDYLDVFYGGLDEKPRNDIDEKIIEKARGFIDELFERKHC